MNKQLTSLKYYNGGGYSPMADLSAVNFELDIRPYFASCTCDLRIGNINVSKEFFSKDFPKINVLVEMLKKVDFDKLSEDARWKSFVDVSIGVIEYQYNEGDIREVKFPNNEGLLKLLSDFIDYYLLKVEECSSVLKSIVNNNEGSYRGLRSLIEDNQVFDEKWIINLKFLRTIRLILRLIFKTESSII